eukprot:gene2501-5431_t
MSRTASWITALQQAVKANKGAVGSNFCQMATIGIDGGPRVRTVVLRCLYSSNDRLLPFGSGICDGCSEVSADEQLSLIFVTDIRAEKVAEIKHQYHGEVVWYATKAREQFRFRGTFQIVSAARETSIAAVSGTPDIQLHWNHLRNTVWKSVSANTRAQMHWPHPGQPRSEHIPDSVWNSPPTSSSVEDDDLPPDTFALAVLHVSRVDHLHLRKNDRYIYSLEHTDMPSLNGSHWVCTRVNP